MAIKILNLDDEVTFRDSLELKLVLPQEEGEPRKYIVVSRKVEKIARLQAEIDELNNT